MSIYPDGTDPPISEEALHQKIASCRPYLHVKSKGEKDLIRLASFDSISETGNEVATMGSMLCFLEDHAESSATPIMHKDDVVERMLNHLKGSKDGSLDWPTILSEEELVPFKMWVESFGMKSKQCKTRGSVEYRDMPTNEEADRHNAGASEHQDSPLSASSSPARELHDIPPPDTVETTPPSSPVHKKPRLEKTKSTIVARQVYNHFMVLLQQVDLLKIGDDKFNRWLELFRKAVELCPEEARHYLSPEDVTVVEEILDEWSNELQTCDRGTDDSKKASSFAWAVIAACFLVEGIKLPMEKGHLQRPDIANKDDALTKAESDQYSSSEVSYEDALKKHASLLAERGELSGPYQQFFEENYTVVDDATPVWVLDLIEMVVDARSSIRKGAVNPIGSLFRVPMFQYVVNNKAPPDENRKLIDCGEDWILYHLAAFPVTKKLEVHGFLATADVSRSRIAKVATYIESLVGENKDQPAEERDQSWHGDFDHLLAKFFGDEFGISVLVGAKKGSTVHVIPRTYGLEEDEEILRRVFEGKVKKIVLQRGQCLVMGPGLRHKGVGYAERNVRLFLAFLVGRSCRANFGSTYGVHDITDELFIVRIIRIMFEKLGLS